MRSFRIHPEPEGFTLTPAVSVRKREENSTQQCGRARGGVEPLGPYQTGHPGIRRHQFRLMEVVLAPLFRPFSNQRGVQSSTELRNTVLGILSRRFLDSLKVQPHVMRQSAAIFQIAECRATLTSRKPKYAHMMM
ncbi:hypothetical protein K438DRAFT_1753527 [Mycena galopus ATCC 62051]|nr:hypothetical protein K438DRAFT_1753527 [Mycena galopus ATCC 62051]